MNSFGSFYLITFLTSLIIFIYLFYKIKSFNPINKKNIFLGKNEIIHLTGFSFSYGVGVDKNGNIFIPDFEKGFIYEIENSYKKSFILKVDKNFLREILFFVKILFFSIFKKLFNIKSSLYKPHEIYFDKNDKMYITQMGLGNLKGRGKVSIFSKEKKLIKEIGINDRFKKGLIDPVMTYVNNNFIYITESGANKILRYKEDKLIDWIGNDNDEYIDNFTKKEDLFFSHSLDKPHAIKIGPDKNYYIVDTSNHRIVKYSDKGNFLGWIGKRENGKINDNWSMDGNSLKGHELGAFNTPIDIVIKNNFIYLSDCFNHRIVRISLLGKSEAWLGETVDKIESDVIWNNKGRSVASNTFLGLHRPFGLKIIKDQLYIADKQNFRIKIIKSENLF